MEGQIAAFKSRDDAHMRAAIVDGVHAALEPIRNSMAEQEKYMNDIRDYVATVANKVGAE